VDLCIILSLLYIFLVSWLSYYTTDYRGDLFVYTHVWNFSKLALCCVVVVVVLILQAKLRMATYFSPP
jgi:hypothetical protein